METLRIQQGESERIEAYFETTGQAALSGLTPALTIRRQSDGFFWNNVSFTSAFSQVTMSAVNAVNQGGYYSYLFDTTSLADANYSIIASGTAAGNATQIGELKVGGYIDNLNKPITQIDAGVGGGVVHLNGVFTKKEKEKLLALISSNFDQIFTLLEPIADILKQLVFKLSAENKTDELKSALGSISEYLEAQTALIKSIDDSKTLLEEIHA